MHRLVRCVVLLAVVGLGAFLSGCTVQTTPATNVTATTATLGASVTLKPSDYGEYWWEYSPDNGNTWTQTARLPYGTPTASCTSNSGSEGEPRDIHQDVSGLKPSTHYIYRFVASVCGSGAYWVDSTGTVQGTNYSSFDTQSQILRQDDATNPDPQALWSPDAGADDCYSGFDSFQTVESGAYDGGPYRRIVVYDGECEEQSIDTERAELGFNSWRGYGDLPPNPDPLRRASNLRTFWLFAEGDTLVTDWWVRLPSDFPIGTDEFQSIEQESQAAPNTSTLSSPVLAVEARQNQIQLSNRGGNQGPGIPITFPAPALGSWFHLQLTARYTRSREDGGVTLCLNGQCKIATNIQTLATFENGGVSPYQQGDSVPSHIRLGIYHGESLPPTSMDVADFTVRTP